MPKIGGVMKRNIIDVDAQIRSTNTCVKTPKDIEMKAVNLNKMDHFLVGVIFKLWNTEM